MCLAFPGKIISIKKDEAEVDFGGIKKLVNVSLVKSAKPGDYIMVHAGFAIQILSKESAEEVFELYERGSNRENK